MTVLRGAAVSYERGTPVGQDEPGTEAGSGGIQEAGSGGIQVARCRQACSRRGGGGEAEADIDVLRDWHAPQHRYHPRRRQPDSRATYKTVSPI